MHALLLSLLLSSPPEWAAEPSPPRSRRALHLTVAITYDIGLTPLFELEYTDKSKEALGANSGLGLALGASLLNLRGGELETQLTLGAKFASIGAGGDGLVWFSFPVEVMEIINLDRLLQGSPYSGRLGLGATYHLSPSVLGLGALSPLAINFDGAPGVVVQLDGGVRANTDPSSGGVFFGVRGSVIALSGSGLQPFPAVSLGFHLGLSI